MAKLTRSQKMELYEKRQSGITMSSLEMEYGIKRDNISYLVRLIDRHGTDILRVNNNRYYSPDFKLEVINRILVSNESIVSLAIELGLSSDGMIHNWIKKYKENGYNVIEKKRGRPPMTKPKIEHKTPLTTEKELEELKKKNQYLEAENEYLKKLQVIVDQRVEREKKKK